MLGGTWEWQLTKSMKSWMVDQLNNDNQGFVWNQWLLTPHQTPFPYQTSFPSRLSFPAPSLYPIAPSYLNLTNQTLAHTIMHHPPLAHNTTCQVLRPYMPAHLCLQLQNYSFAWNIPRFRVARNISPFSHWEMNTSIHILFFEKLKCWIVFGQICLLFLL